MLHSAAEGHLECLKAHDARRTPCEIPDEKLFFRVVKASFAQRRKTLLNALSSGFGEYSKPQIAAAIEDAGFSPTVRGETLDIPGFAAICAALLKL
ncbi:MAG: hypothetical protein ACLR8U_02330 [Oscillospiraceae bacterium]